MPNVLAVAALELRHPVAFLVAMKPGDPPRHRNPSGHVTPAAALVSASRSVASSLVMKSDP